MIFVSILHHLNISTSFFIVNLNFIWQMFFSLMSLKPTLMARIPVLMHSKKKLPSQHLHTTACLHSQQPLGVSMATLSLKDTSKRMRSSCSRLLLSKTCFDLTQQTDLGQFLPTKSTSDQQLTLRLTPSKGNNLSQRERKCNRTVGLNRAPVECFFKGSKNSGRLDNLGNIYIYIYSPNLQDPNILLIFICTSNQS